MLMASFFVTAPQGRISAHWNLKWNEKDEVLSSNTLVEEFKTSDTYGYQPIVCSKLSREILLFFIGIYYLSQLI
jgi:hypothetical protein